MSNHRRVKLSLFLTLLMLAMPWAAADVSTWIGPNQIASNGQDVTVDGWTVPGNASILDGWMTVEDEMVADGNGTEWTVDTTTNFSVGQFTNATMSHFDGHLSLQPDAAVSQVDSFLGVASLQFAFSTITESGNTSIWEPGMPPTVNGTQVGNTMQMPYGNQPASAHGGGIVAATLMNESVPPGIDASLHASAGGVPSPVNHFNLSFWNWRHTDADDGLWVEYKLDNGPWTWMAPAGGYNSNITLNATATPAGTPNNNTTFPVWSDATSTGWVQETFNLDNLTGLGNATNIEFRWRIVTDANSTGRPGWFLDDFGITNVGGATGYWHHGCYVQTGTCGYSNSAIGVLQGSVDLSNANAGSEIHVMLEWDLEGSGWDNFCVELSSNNNTWTDISSSTSATTNTCRSRTGAIPGSGTTVGGTTYGDETNGFVVLEMAVPSTFQNSGMTDIRFRVDTDSSVTYGGTTDNMEGLTLDRISVHDGSNNVVDIDQLSNSNSMWHYSLNTVDDWSYIQIGAGSLSSSYGFEDSTATAPTPMPPGWSATGSWDFGPLATTSAGPISWPSGPFGLGTNLAGYADDNAIDHLYSPAYAIPAGASARLTFDSWMCADVGYGGGAVFISTNNNTWTHFNPGNNWYDSTAYTWRTGGTLGNLEIFDGSNTIPPGGFSCNGPHDIWDPRVADISSYSGQTVWFRFTYEPYAWCCQEGWYIDDIGLEVDYFLEEGNWISDVIQVDDLGMGFIDVDGIIPDSTWATGTVMDAAGNVIPGFHNISFPISLHGLNKDSHSGIRVQVNMGTDDPFLTPILNSVHVGSVRTMNALGPGNGWDVSPSLGQSNGNLTNSGSAVLQINGDFVHSSRPITSVSFAGIGSQVTVRAIDSRGQVVGQSGLSGTITFPEPQPGFGVRIEINPGGRISSLRVDGAFGQPAVDPTADVASDGTIDWSFPTGAAYGNHGWQTLLYESTGPAGTITHNSDTATMVEVQPPAGATISVLVPGDAIVTSATVSLAGATGAFQGTGIDLTVGTGPVTTFTGVGMVTRSLPSSLIAQINMVPSQSGLQADRDWRVVDLEFDSTVLDIIHVNAVTIGYSITENVTALTDQMVTYHAAAVAAGAGTSVDIPVTYNAGEGAVVLGGGIHHELMITNHPFSVPTTMYPDGDVIEITTRHQHLYDNDDISKIALSALASDGTTVLYQLMNPTGAANFSQITGVNGLPMEADCSVSEVNGVLEVKWRFHVSWNWDDIASIDWTAMAYNQTGISTSKATAQSGGQGSQAIENDLEVSGFIIRDEKGYDISNRFSPDYPFHVRSGHDVNISGNVRFQNTVDHRPLASDFAMIVNVSGVELPLNVDGNGTYSGQVTLPVVIEHTLSPRIGRVGPITGATGANDSTVSPPSVTILIDDEAPVAEDFLVSTSVGLLEANGFVWDPVLPLTVHITVSDAQARSESVTLNYWREGIDDANSDGVAQASEYQTMAEPTFTLRSGSQQISFRDIQIAANGFNGKVSLWLSGTDWAGNSYQEGGTGGGPGLGNDWATLQTAQNTDTILLNTGFSLDAIDEYLLAGQSHTFSIIVQDANGVQTLDDIGVYLAGQVEAPLGEFHYDPRQQVLSSVAGSHVQPLSALVTPLSEDTARVDLTFAMDWDTPTTEGFYVPGVTVTDDTRVVANVNNLNALRWNIDNAIIAVVTGLSDLTPPVSEGTPDRLNVRQGDEIAIDGEVRYALTGVSLTSPSDGLSVRAQILYGSTLVEQTVSVQTGGGFSIALVLPMRAPLTPEMPIELTVLNLPGISTSTANTDASLVVDSDAPVVVFDAYRFPITSLTFLESDRLDSILVDVIISDVGGMPEGDIVVHWDFLRSGLPRLGLGGTSSLALLTVTEAEHHYNGQLDLRPPEGEGLLEGDQIILWFDGTDLSGNALIGEGTEGSPRVPTLAIIEFIPVLTTWQVTPDPAEFGDVVTIEAVYVNQGMRSGSLNLSLVERIDGAWHPHGDAVTIQLGSKATNVVAMFSWEAWKAGPADLYILIDGDETNPVEVPRIEVQEASDTKGLVDDNGLLIAIVGILILAVVILLGVLVLRKPSDSIDDFDPLDDGWEEDDVGAEVGTIRLDYEDSTIWNTAARHGIHDRDAFLEHAQRYDRDNDGFLDADELERAAGDFTALLATPMIAPEGRISLDHRDETVAHVVGEYGILDEVAFLAFANAYDADGNGFLKESELTRAATDYVATGYNTLSTRTLAIAEVRAALPDWDEAKISSWMDKGWTAAQLINAHGEAEAPPAPEGFGVDYVTPEIEVEVEPELAEVIVEAEAEPLPSEAAMKRMKKAELVEMAAARDLDSSGTKADIIARLLG
jgi:hypothetical protein